MSRDEELVKELVNRQRRTQIKSGRTQKPNFVRVVYPLIDMMASGELSRAAFTLWIVMRKHADWDDGYTYVKQETLANIMRCTRQYVDKLQDELILLDLLEIEQLDPYTYRMYVHEPGATPVA